MTKDDQGFWNFIFAVFFVLVVFAGMTILFMQQGKLPTTISFFDAVLVALATFRFIRLFVYDKITEFFRDWFVQKTVFEGQQGEIVIVRQKLAFGPRRTISDLLSCPWCFGVWAAFTVLFFYYLTPFSWFVILGLAVAGAGSFLQLLSNMIGWHAEHLKKETEG